MKHVAIVGGGIVGLATAYRLLDTEPRLRVTVLEKEDAVGRHQTSHNSGVLHCGLHYAPGSTKARLARAGIRMMVEFCIEHDVPHEICGKLVVATEPAELGRLDALEQRGRANGLIGLRRLSPAEARDIEPHARSAAALHVPEEGIVDYTAVARALAAALEAGGAQLRTRAEVRALTERLAGWSIETSAGELEADLVLTCAGLHADRVAMLAGERPGVRILPFRGEYYTLRADRRSLVRNLIYPVPDPSYPFLGVHFTRMIGGGVEAGPNAVLAFAREGYRRTDVDLADLFDALAFPGLRRFLARHGRMAANELARSFSKRRFTDALRRLVPEIEPADLEPGGAGVRAQAMLPSGELVHDFLILERPRALHLLNAPSPAATASLAIGEELARRVRQRL